jgi:site-specific recombinase XerD
MYRRAYERFWRWAATRGLERNDQVEARTINAWYDSLFDEPLSDTTRALLYRNLSPFWKWWSRETGLPNPFATADAPRTPQQDPIPVVPMEDLRRLLTSCPTQSFLDRRDEAIISVLIDTGIRLGELVGMTTQSWDRRVDGLVVSGKTGTRIVQMGEATADAMGRYRRVRDRSSFAARPEWWLGKQGPIGVGAVAHMLRRRCAAVGIEPINPHRFRHTFSHEFRAAGGSEGDLMYLLGWSSLAMAQRYGRSAAGERAREAHRRFGLRDRV